MRRVPEQRIAKGIGDGIASMVSSAGITLCNLMACTDTQRHIWSLSVLEHAERYIINTYCDGKDPRYAVIEEGENHAVSEQPEC